MAAAGVVNNFGGGGKGGGKGKGGVDGMGGINKIAFVRWIMAEWKTWLVEDMRVTEPVGGGGPRMSGARMLGVEEMPGAERVMAAVVDQWAKETMEGGWGRVAEEGWETGWHGFRQR